MNSFNFGYSWTPTAGTLGTGNFGGVIGFYIPVGDLFQGYCWYVRRDNKIYRGTMYGGYQAEYTAPAGTFRHINTAAYGGPIWAVRNNGEISACVMCNIGGVVPVTGEVPISYILKQNYPNPFNPSTTLEFGVPVNSHVKLAVYNSTGQLIDLLADKNLNAGLYAVNWDSSRFASGIYFYSLIASDDQKTFSETKKMVLVK